MWTVVWWTFYFYMFFIDAPYTIGKVPYFSKSILSSFPCFVSWHRIKTTIFQYKDYRTFQISLQTSFVTFETVELLTQKESNSLMGIADSQIPETNQKYLYHKC